MSPKDYNEIIREYFDISDDRTRKYIISLEDAGKDDLLTSLSSALYDKIVQKVDKIDFGTIPKSRGDITKVQGFENTMECLDIIKRLVTEYRENTDIVDNVINAVENVKQRRNLFMKAFVLNVELPMVLYNLVTLSIIQSVSFLITVCIQYIKDTGSTTIKTALDKAAYVNTKDNMIYQQLISFNNTCTNRELDRTLETVIKNTKKVSESAPIFPEFEDDGYDYDEAPVDSPFKKFDDCPDSSQKCAPPAGADFSDNGCRKKERYAGMPPMGGRIAINGGGEVPGDRPIEEFGVGTIAGLVVGGATVLSFGLKGLRYLIKVIIPVMRNITYFFINSRVKLSDSLELQAQFIEVNAYKLKYSNNSNLDEEKKGKVVEKQLKWAERLKNWANKIAIDSKKAQKDAKDQQKDDDEKIKIGGSDDSDDSGSIF